MFLKVTIHYELNNVPIKPAAHLHSIRCDYRPNFIESKLNGITHLHSKTYTMLNLLRFHFDLLATGLNGVEGH